MLQGTSFPKMKLFIVILSVLFILSSGGFSLAQSENDESFVNGGTGGHWWEGAVFSNSVEPERGALVPQDQVESTPSPQVKHPEVEEQAVTLASSGLFKPYVTCNKGSWPYAVGMGDFNSDGLQDVAMTTGNQLYVFLQNISGTLDAPAPYATGTRPESLAVGDLNNDGRQDVAVANVSDNTIGVFLQQLDGTLAAQVTYKTAQGPDAVAVADLNNDGLDDVVVSHWNAASLGVFIQKSDGTLQSMTTYSAPNAGYDDLDVGDLNDDGRMDVVKMNGQLYANPNLSVYLQKADGTLNTPVSYDLGDINGNGVAVGDVTGDGLADIVLSYGGNSPSAKLAVFAQTITGSLVLNAKYSAYDIPEPVEIADVNLDGREDVLVANGGWNTLSVFLQQQDGTLAPYERYAIPYASHYGPQGLDVGDINNDGLPDVVIADYNHGLVVLYHTASDLEINVEPGLALAEPGDNVSWAISATASGWTSMGISLTVRGLPDNATSTFLQNPLTLPDSTRLDVQLGPDTPLGIYPLSVVGTVGNEVYTATTELKVVEHVARVFLPAVMRNFFKPIFDDFSNPSSGWPVADTSVNLYEYRNGEYRIYNKTTDYVGAATADHHLDDIDLAIAAHQAGSARGTYGLAFGINDTFSDYYIFLVWPDFQEWDLFHYQYGSGFTALKSGTSSTILTGNNHNRLRVVKSGDSLTLWVNDVCVFDGTYATYTGYRQTGLFAGPYDAGHDARFDDYALSRP